ncbi:MAG: UDP-N-acetylmuramate dehydrogenase, partial [Patescibacteria group bacterium]
IESEAGVSLGRIVVEAVSRNLSGAEWAVGIPGTLGGAVRGNAGAFGGSMSDAVRNVSAVDLKTGGIKKFNNSECLFAYRESVFKIRNNFLIWSVKLSLKKGDKKALKEKISEIMQYRQLRHPLDYPSFGSAFKNIYDKKIIKKITEKFPNTKEGMEKWGDKIPAAYLIDQCGLKGKAIGGIMISPKQPNFLLNMKNGKAKDALALIDIIKESVMEKFGVILETEVQIIGFNN